MAVADARVQEADGAFLSFAVTLSRSPSSEVSVDYATSDGTAHAGADYTATSGTLTIPARTTAASIDVPILDDAHDDDETLTLTLSNPSSGAVLNDATATGTIDNNNAMPRALIAHFGRTTAAHVIDQVKERINAPRQPGFDGQLAGRNIDRNMGRDFALGFLRRIGGNNAYGTMGTSPPMHGGASRHAGTAGTAAPHGRASAMTPGTDRTSQAAMGAMPGRQHRNGGIGMGLGYANLLTGSRFALNRGTKTGGVLSVWSRSAQSHFHGREGVLSINGNVRTTMVGADYARNRLMTGVSLAHSRGLGRYSGEDDGNAASAMAGVYPWIGYRASERVTIWTVGGYGRGGLMLDPGTGAPMETGVRMGRSGPGAAGGGSPGATPGSHSRSRPTRCGRRRRAARVKGRGGA